MSQVLSYYFLTPSSSASPKWRIRRYPISSGFSSSPRRHHRRRRSPWKPNQPKPSRSQPPPDQNLQMVIDVDNFSSSASRSVQNLLDSWGFHRFLHSGNDAVEDLQTLVTVDPDGKFVVSCRRSTVQFVGNLALCSCVIVFALRVLVKLGLGFWGKMRSGRTSGLVVTRRDRSLGGREVVVGRNEYSSGEFKVLENPLSSSSARSISGAPKKNLVSRREEKLPSWWPVSLPTPVLTDDNQDYQKMAKRYIRAILDCRVSGKDIAEDDILQFRRLCRMSGARVVIDTTNARDSFYRLAVNFVLNSCGSATSRSTSVDFDGEDARQFIAGLADNIGLQNIRAAKMVSGAVAARTRSCFLQAWALEMQGKHHETVAELSKICLIHRTFPPEECSPEMEMVARGLEKHLKLEQRELLMEMLIDACGEGFRISAAEALGLVPSHEREL